MEVTYLTAINQALQGDQVRPVLAKLAVQPQIGSAKAFTAFLRQQRLQWGAVIKLANIQASD